VRHLCRSGFQCLLAPSGAAYVAPDGAKGFAASRLLQIFRIYDALKGALTPALSRPMGEGESSAALAANQNSEFAMELFDLAAA
jgi:hypothetical protein